MESDISHFIWHLNISHHFPAYKKTQRPENERKTIVHRISRKWNCLTTVITEHSIYVMLIKTFIKIKLSQAHEKLRLAEPALPSKTLRLSSI